MRNNLRVRENTAMDDAVREQLRPLLGSGYPDDENMRRVLLQHMTKILENWKADTTNVRELLLKNSMLYPVKSRNGNGK